MSARRAGAHGGGGADSGGDAHSHGGADSGGGARSHGSAAVRGSADGGDGDTEGNGGATAVVDAAAVETEEVVVDFGGLRAVDKVSLRVEAGERRAIIGPNGAGKTTLFNLIAGQRRPTQGRVRLFGRDVTRKPAPQRARMGLGRTFQVTQLLSGLTVEDNVRLAVAGAQAAARRAFWGPLAGRRAVTAPAAGLLRQWELWPLRDRLVSELGHGEQRVLELAMALAGRPRLLLLDEPTAGLGRAEAALVTDLVTALPTDLTLLLIEHDTEVAFAVADRVSVMVDGAILITGTPHEVRRDEAVITAYLGAVGDA